MARDLLSKGTRWRVDDGRQINIWKDRWIPSMPNFSLLPRNNTSDSDVQNVHELIDFEHSIWNTELLQGLLSNWEINEIKKILIAMFPQKDRWTWYYSKFGSFSVRSAYHLDKQQNNSNQASTSNGNAKLLWKKLWAAEVPPKVRNFGWRALKNAIPVNLNLSRRGIRADSLCQQCGEKEESVIHMLARCPAAQIVWYISPLRIDTRQMTEVSLWEWCNSLMKIYKDKLWWKIFWMILWSIWLDRNSKMFKRTSRQPNDSVEQALKFLADYELANKITLFFGNSSECTKRWRPSPENIFKINSDAAIFKEGACGFGAVMRDSVGDVIITTCSKMEGAMEVDVAEALATRQSLVIAHDSGLRDVILETDNIKLFNHLKKNLREASYFGSIVADITRLAESFCSHSFSDVKREGNMVAHNLARLSLNFEDKRVWIKEVPESVTPFVTNDQVFFND